MQTWSLVGGSWHEGDAADATCRWFALDARDAANLEALAKRYHLHPLAVEDCLSHLLHAPKVDDFGDYLFIVLQAITVAHTGMDTQEFDAFVGSDFLITFVDDPQPFAETFGSVEQALREGRPVRQGADGLFYELADRMVDHALPQVDILAEDLDGLQRTALEAGNTRQHREITQVRARAGGLRRLLAAQVSVMLRLSRGEFQQVADANRMYYRDVYDHLVRLDLSLETLREDAEVALSTSLSVLNNQMNEVMKVLAIVGALALPATLIAGIFGTNFHDVPWLQSAWGFWAMIGVMVGVAVGMAGYFWRRGWF